MPALEVIAVDLRPSPVASSAGSHFDATDDPCRLSLSASGRCAAVLLAKTNQTLAIDLSAPETPRLIGRTKPTGADAPYVSYSPDSDWIMMPVASPSEAIAIESPRRRSRGRRRQLEPIPPTSVDYLVCTRHRDSVLELFQTEPRHSLGRLPFKGPLNLGRTRPTGWPTRATAACWPSPPAPARSTWSRCSRGRCQPFQVRDRLPPAAADAHRH